MATPEFIKIILEANSIEEYLQKHGIDPAYRYGSRIKYSCPLHGPEKEPSFYVFTNSEFENYKCFGCGAFGDVINLCSVIEGIPLKEAIGKLSSGLELPGSEDDLNRYARDIENSGSDDSDNISRISFMLSRSCYEYLKSANFDSEEVAFMDRVFEKVDVCIHALDQDATEAAYRYIADVGIPNRLKYRRKQREQSMALKYRSAK